MADFSHYFLISVVSTGAVLFIASNWCNGCAQLVHCLSTPRKNSIWFEAGSAKLALDTSSVHFDCAHATVLTVQR